MPVSESWKPRLLTATVVTPPLEEVEIWLKLVMPRSLKSIRSVPCTKSVMTSRLPARESSASKSKRSEPAPPVRVSAPLSPLRRSLPAPALSTSLPWSPSRRSAPNRRSLRSSAGSRHPPTGRSTRSAATGRCRGALSLRQRAGVRVEHQCHGLGAHRREPDLRELAGVAPPPVPTGGPDRTLPPVRSPEAGAPGGKVGNG